MSTPRKPRKRAPKPAPSLVPDPMAVHFKSERPPAHEDKIDRLAAFAVEQKNKKEPNP